MNARTLSICVGAVALAATGFIYGVKFCKKRNYLIGVEWFVLAISSSNFLVYELNQSQVNYLGVLYLDTFSRAFGIPIVTTAGLMVLTHRYKPTLLADVMYFVVPAAATLLLLTKPMAAILPYFLLAMWTVFTLYLFYFASRLWKFGQRAHAVGVTLAALSNQAIASIYDFYKIPGDETNIVFNFYTIALFVWAYLTVQIYYSYCALERELDGRLLRAGTRTGWTAEVG
jgi:hypothetical protein